MQTLEERDYFTDYSILKDPYEYFEAIRAKGPIYRHPDNGIIFVTGYAEALEVLNNTKDFSSVIAPQGPAMALPFEPSGDDITAQIEAHRTEFIGGDLVVAYDDRQHSFSRSILSRLFTPSRLKANEEFISEYADQIVKEVIAKGECDLINEIATPFVTLVIANLLGVPDDDTKVFMDEIAASAGAGSLNPEEAMLQDSPLVLMGTYFVQYVLDRRENPRQDVLSELANAKYPDGSTPDPLEIVRLGTFLFAAGQDTSAKLLGNSMRYIVDVPGLQDKLRADPALIPAFIEEVLRLEGSTKMTARLARKNTKIGDMEIAAGTKVFVGLAAANRDPGRWESPQELILNRPKIKEHLAFSRGAHVCAGAPLARVEVRVILERFLAYTSNIDLSEEVHGSRGNRHLEFEPSFIIRGLAKLHLKLTPKDGVPIAPSSAATPKKAGFFGFGKKTDDAPKAVTGYSTATTKIGDLLANPCARGLLDKHFPGVSTDPKISMGKGMTLRTVQKFAKDVFTDEKLDALDAELAQLPAQ